MAGAKGTATLDFGVFPGASDATLVVAAAGVTPTTAVEAWVLPVATSDHSVDEQMVEPLAVYAVAGTDEFTIRGFNTNPLFDASNSCGTRLYGDFNIGWVWES